MSYEGYNIFLCVNGHYNAYDAYDEVPYECEDCQAQIAWTTGVDQTNCSGVEPSFVTFKEAQSKNCPTCNHCSVVSEEQFEIPINAGTRLIPVEDLKVPMGSVKFVNKDNDDWEKIEFCTEEEAWGNQYEDFR